MEGLLLKVVHDEWAFQQKSGKLNASGPEVDMAAKNYYFLVKNGKTLNKQKLNLRGD